MTSTRVELVGLREAVAALRKLPVDMRADAQAAINTTAFQVARSAQASVRRRTGLLASRIEWEARPRSLSAVVRIAGDAFYWKFIEYGTVRMPARPFLRPAAMAAERDHEQRLNQAIDKSLRKLERSASSRFL